MKGENNVTAGGFRGFCDRYVDWISIVLIFIYVLTFKSLGFVVSSMLYLMLQITVMGRWDRKSMLIYAAVSIIVPIIIFFIFRRWFSVMLPKGILDFLRM